MILNRIKFFNTLKRLIYYEMEEETSYVTESKLEEITKLLLKRLKAVETRVKTLELDITDQPDNASNKMSNMRFQFSKEKS